MKTRATLAIFAAVLIASLSNNATAHANQRACGEYDTSQPIQAAVIIEDLKNCDVSLGKATIERELRLGDESDGETVIEHNLKLHEVLILGTGNFSNLTFKGYADFTASTFEGHTFFLGSIFEGNAIFTGSTFKGYADFTGSVFKGNASFWGSTFEGNASFLVSAFEGNTSFVISTFEGNLSFFRSTFKGDTTFSSTSFNGFTDFREASFASTLHFDPRINNKIWPPISNPISTELTWNDVKDSFPHEGDVVEMHLRWVNIFTIANKFLDVEQARTSQRRFQLSKLLLSVGAGFGGSWFVFIFMYYRGFGRVYRRSELRYTLKLAAFSLDVISPSIRPWKYDWDRDGGLPVRRVAIMTAFESAIGWILLALGSAVTVAWLTA